jgi:hypothetical protein
MSYFFYFVELIFILLKLSGIKMQLFMSRQGENKIFPLFLLFTIIFKLI